MLFIEVPDMNDSMSEIIIDETSYLIRFTYNPSYDYWTFGIYDIDENPIIASVKIVPNYPLLEWYTYSELPDGIWGCLSDSETIGREAFNDGTAEFIYIPNSELDGEGEASLLEDEYDREE